VSELEDAALVALARDGQTNAFEVLYRRHVSYALNVAVRIQGHAGDVEDIVHDAFIKAHERLVELRDAQLFRPWLGSIVVRLVRSRLRRRRLLSALGLAVAEPIDLDAIAAEDASPETRAQLAQVYALLQTFPADERIAWTLRYIERHRLETVAEMVGCSLATVKRRILRAQRFLTEHFVAPFAAREPAE
jgi:RNA polymerase sigma-70 factor (ECF subfamily)